MRGSSPSRGPASRSRSARASPRPSWRRRETSPARCAAQQLLATPAFRVYSGLDVIGVELAGALKNVIAIAAGILEGLGLGHNPRAALITRGLAEITRLGVAMGADPLDLRGARRHGRPGPHDHRKPQPESRARRGAGAGADTRGIPDDAPERSRRRQYVRVPASPWARAWVWSSRSFRRSARSSSAGSRRGTRCRS